MASSRLPPTSALKAFVVTAQSGSFTQAARDLNLTQSAISQAVRGLEADLGTALFVRDVGRVALTPEGEAYRDAIAPALDAIALATAQARQAAPASLSIGCVRSLLNNWLLARLPGFSSQFPMLDISMQTLGRDVRSLGGCDVVIILASKQAPPKGALWLHDEALIPVAAPGLNENERTSPDPSLIGQNWALWLDPISQRARGPAIQLRETSAQLAAARAGQGLALLPDLVCYDDLSAGRLVRLSPKSVSRDRAFYIMQAPSGGRAVTDFVAWLQAQVAACAKPMFGAIT
ncbi:LysR family transcriptional regulator [Brevundimonas diminuta]|uniref:LysR family transcriptional regulator n=1 Tax=Brevundimonas diminuta TaxID=293 RepID=UPI0021D40F01|nr:LysR family transcriptional regulator [Brevundimonas diminuta]